MHCCCSMLSAGLAEEGSQTYVILASFKRLFPKLRHIDGKFRRTEGAGWCFEIVLSSAVDISKKRQTNGPQQICLIYRCDDRDPRVQ